MTRRWTMSLLPMTIMILLNFNSEIWTLPAPSGVFMKSIDMRHTLRWRPLQALCNTSILYYVQFQGEFELNFLNGKWVDAPECQLIRHTHCDLTFDLGSDSDYNLQVRAQCGRQLSAWTKLSRPFNRRHTVLTVPEMRLSVAGDTLQVSFEKLPLTAVVSVKMWKRGGDETQAAVYMMPAEQGVQHIPNLQEGEEYCVRAKTILDTELESRSTEAHCVSIKGPDAAWKGPTTVTVTVIVMASLMFAVFWSISHCRSDACQTYFHKEPLPYSLRKVWDFKIPQEPELCEHIHVVQMDNSEEQGSKTTAVSTSDLDDQSIDCVLE